MSNTLETPEKQPPAWTIRLRELRQSGHLPVRHRALFPVKLSKNPLVRACAVLWPWEGREYPGVTRLRAWLLGMSNLGSVRVYARIRVPGARLRIVAGKLRAKAAELLAMADELEGLAGKPVCREPKRSGRVARVPPPVAD